MATHNITGLDRRSVAGATVVVLYTPAELLALAQSRLPELVLLYHAFLKRHSLPDCRADAPA